MCGKKMIMTNRFLMTILLMCIPVFANAEAYNADDLAQSITTATSIVDAKEKYLAAYNAAANAEEYKNVSQDVKAEQENIVKQNISNAIVSDDSTESEEEATTIDEQKEPSEESTDQPTQEEINAQRIQEAQAKYDAAREKEQSLANRALSAVTTAATGIGGMELAMGLSQQKADKDAAADMEKYIETLRCSYGNGKTVKAGSDEIELPGGNDQKLMNYRAEYLSLAASLKERKSALGMKPGIESEEILDKATMNLYDDENVGITSGQYESLYRAQMLGSETDQAKIDEQKEASKKRVMGGAIAAGAGAVVGVVGNSLINGKLGEAIKAAKERRNSKVDTEETITVLDLKEKISTLSEEDLEELRKVLGIK